MSILDMDERLLQLLTTEYDLVYSPLVDVKVFQKDVDITLVEGAVSTESDIQKIKMVRRVLAHSRIVRRLRCHCQCSIAAQFLTVNQLLERVSAGQLPASPDDCPPALPLMLCRCTIREGRRFVPLSAFR